MLNQVIVHFREHAIDFVWLGLFFALIGALGFVASDLLKIAREVRLFEPRLAAVEAGNVREDADEKQLHSETTQLREELDSLHRKIEMLRRAVPRETLTSLDESASKTRALIRPPAPANSDTQAFSPGAPKLPRFDLAAETGCGAFLGEACRWAPTGICDDCKRLHV